MKSFLEFILAWVSAVITGVCLAFMWRWFITPLGVPAISTIHAVGLCFLKVLLFAKKDPKTKVEVENILYVILFDCLALFFAFLIHLAM